MNKMPNAECQMPNGTTGNESPVCWRAPAWLLTILFIVLFAIAIPLDTPLSKAAHECGLAGFLKTHQNLTWVWRFPGNFFYAVIATTHFLAYRWVDRDVLKRRIWREPSILIISGILSGVNQVGKWTFGRYRPYKGHTLYDLHWFRDGWRGMFETKDLGFPSGDAAMAFAAAFSLAIIMPRWRWLWFTLAILVSIERVCENSHYPTDVVAGAALGWICALAAWAVTDKILPEKTLDGIGGKL